MTTPRRGLTRRPWAQKRLEGYETELAFQHRVTDLAELLGWYCWHVNLPMRSKAGFPDLLLIRERIVWVELKVWHAKGGRGKVMPEQEQFHELLRCAGGEVYVWFNDDDTWEEIKEVLSRGGQVVAT